MDILIEFLKAHRSARVRIDNDLTIYFDGEIAGEEEWVLRKDGAGSGNRAHVLEKGSLEAVLAYVTALDSQEDALS